MAKVRTHKKQVEQARGGLSQDGIRQAVNARRRARGEAIKGYNLSLKALREQNRPSAKEQLKKLDFRLGKGQGATRERAKLAEKIKSNKDKESQNAASGFID